jgi:hypothetical protein
MRNTIDLNVSEETMQAAYHTTTTILPGNKIEIELPEGTIGEAIEVIILLPNKTTQKKRSALDIIADARKIPPYRTPEEVDQDIQEEGNSWDD